MPHGRAAAVLASLAVAGLLTAACSGPGSKRPAGGNHYGELPSGGGRLTGGVVSIAEDPGAGPNYIFPITPVADTSVYDINQFQYYMWRPLWWGPSGDTPALDYSQSIAKAAAFSNQDKTVTIRLNPNWKWSDGAPVTAKDVLFDIDLTEAAVKLSPGNDGGYAPGFYPDFVTSMSAPNPTTVVLTLDKTYNQDFLSLDELPLIVPLPAHAWAEEAASGAVLPENAWFDSDPSTGPNLKTDEAIYTFLNSQSMDLATYATNALWQVVDGPFKLKSFDLQTDANVMVPNAAYSGPVKPSISELDNVAFTSISAEFNQLLSDNLTVGYVDPSDIPQVDKLKANGYTVWGYPDFGFSFIAYNFKDQTGHFADIIKQLYIRQALAMLQDEPEVIQSRTVFDGAAGQAYGPVPVIPKSPFAPSDAVTNPYPYTISNAAQLLSSHGWKVVAGGTTTCQSAGTGADQCGAGIPEGTPLSWGLIRPTSGVEELEDNAFAANAKQVGVDINGGFPDTIVSNFTDVGSNANDDAWAMQEFGGYPDSYYPTTDQIFGTTGQYNLGGYSDPHADALINASITSLSGDAMANEIAYIIQQQPGLFQANPDVVLAFKDTLHGPVSSFEDASQYQFSPEYWYFGGTGSAVCQLSGCL